MPSRIIRPHVACEEPLSTPSFSSAESDSGPHGLRTRPTPKKPERPLSRTQLASMLRNPYYVGVVRYAGIEYEGRMSI
jgi:hypothetical protein